MASTLEPPADLRLPLLVTGIAGVAGLGALEYFRHRFPGQVVGIRQRDAWRQTGPAIEACDLEDHAALGRLFKQYRFGSVLDCAGNCALRACELDTRLAWRTNVEGLTNLLTQVVEYKTRLVHLSIDLVFAGRPGGGYREDEPTDPVTVYGKTMVAAEQLIADWVPDACVLRISLPMGTSFNGHAGAIDWIESRFKKDKPATLYYDEIRTPTYTDCLNRVFEDVLASDLRGLYHAGGPRRLSLFQIAQIINRAGRYDPALLLGCPRCEAGPIPPRAGNVTLDSSRLAAVLGYRPFAPWPASDRLRPTDRRWHYHREPDDPPAESLLRLPGDTSCRG